MSTKPRDLILSLKNVPGEAVTVPEGGGATVFVGSIGAALRSRIMEAAVGDEDEMRRGIRVLGLMPEIVCDSLRDPETRERLFTEADLGLIRQLDHAMIQRLGQLALKHSRLTADAVGESKAFSEGTPSDSSISS